MKMNDTKMKPKLITLFLLPGLISLLVVGCWSSQKATAALMQNSFNQLEEIRGVKRNQNEEFFYERINDVAFLSKNADDHKMYASPHCMEYHPRAWWLSNCR